MDMGDSTDGINQVQPTEETRAGRSDSSNEIIKAPSGKKTLPRISREGLEERTQNQHIITRAR
jgi:hypothetical protein